MQNQATGQKTRTNYEEEQYMMYRWVPSKESEVTDESEKVPKGDRLVILLAEAEGSSGRCETRSPNEGG